METLPLLLPADEPVLLPLNLCHPPAFDCEAAPVEADPVDGDPVDGLRLMADVLPEDDEEGFTAVEPALCAAGDVPGEARNVPAGTALAERVIA